MNELDPRLVQVKIEVNGVEKTYSEGLAIVANGTKYANALQNECEITLNNLDKATQDYLLTETSPFNRNRTPKIVRLYAGRQSYGVALVYVGNIISSSVSQPPDIGVTLKCLTGNFIKGNVLSRNFPGSATLSQVSRQFASDNNLALNFQATDKNIGNVTFSGAASKQIELLGTMSNLNVYVDDSALIVKDAWIPLTGQLRVLDADSGMIGIPQFTEQGVKVKYLLDNKTTLGGALQIISRVYPAINGTYVIYKLNFEITSRDTPFYYTAEAAFRR